MKQTKKPSSTAGILRELSKTMLTVFSVRGEKKKKEVLANKIPRTFSPVPVSCRGKAEEEAA